MEIIERTRLIANRHFQQQQSNHFELAFVASPNFIPTSNYSKNLKTRQDHNRRLQLARIVIWI